MDRTINVSLLLLFVIIIIKFSAGATKSVIASDCSQRKLQNNIYQYKCVYLRTFQKYLDKAEITTNEIVVQDSKIQTIPGHAFIRFVGSLKSLDLHLCGIESIDPQAFIGLVNLEKLILWGNKLNWVPATWFLNLQNLRVLDLSFNQIQNIEYQVYSMLPNVENFYIDYNQLKSVPFNFFSFLTKLKKVKFGMNPLNWAFRVHLTWQLIYQKVEYRDDWENWDWFSDVVRECVETGQGSIPTDQVLECVTLKLIEFNGNKLFNSSNEIISIPCFQEVSSLLTCTNASDNKGQGVRKALQGMDKIWKHMEFSLAKFDLV